MRRLAFAVAALALAAAPACALQRCKVTDPTGTPLNVRNLDMEIVGTIENGEIVLVKRSSTDKRGKAWVLVETPEGENIGWVYREFISCF